MPYYVKVTKEVREALLPADVSVVKAKDGNYILYQSALANVEGKTLSDRVKYVGGALLTALQAKQEVSGEICEACHTPKAYGGSDESEGDPGAAVGDNEGVPSIPAVDGGASATDMPAVNESEAGTEDNVNNEKEESEVNDEQE